MYLNTTAVSKILGLRKPLKIIQGGSSAGKTIATLLILIDRAQSEKNKVFSVVSETMPHLKRGAMRDFLNIMKEHAYYQDGRWNKSDFIYTFETGTKIEFFSADSSDKVKGPRRNVLFMNEANNISYETYRQLMLRTSEEIYLDYNPSDEFWVHTDVMKYEDHDFIILTYLDNEGLSERIVKSLESQKHDFNFWQVYGLGQLGVTAARIYKDWEIIDEIPKEARLISRGNDFGYTNDPTALVDIWYCDNGYIFDEQIYETGLLNKYLATRIKGLPQWKTLIIADSAEPKSIDELTQLYGLSVLPATKGKGSVNQGIQFVQAQKCSVTKRSTNIIREYRRYSFITDQDGKVTNEPRDADNHAMDAIRYGMQIKMSSDKPSYQQPPQENPLQGEYGIAEDPTPILTAINLVIPHAPDTPIIVRQPSYTQPEWESPSNL